MQPKKSLGQNFLRDEKILQKIIEASNLKPDDFVIEVGPGEGVLTEELAKHVKKVLAIEIDERLMKKLQAKFPAETHCNASLPARNVEIIHGDILEINLVEIIGKFVEFADTFTPVETGFKPVSTINIIKTRSLVGTGHCPVPTGDMGIINYKLIANIPYYITSAIIRLFLECAYPPAEMILMVQKEVAKRICAKPGEMSILAVSVQYYAQQELLFYVDKKSFFPVPEVDSAVIKIKVASKKYQVPNEERKRFFRLVKAGFSAKRKTLVNNLANGLRIDKNIVEEKIKAVGLKPTARAQELSVEDWKKLETII